MLGKWKVSGKNSLAAGVCLIVKKQALGIITVADKGLGDPGVV